MSLFEKLIICFLLILPVHSIFANESITTMTDYSRNSMEELGASPPLSLLKNKKGESRHEIIAGLFKSDVDGKATITDGSITDELGSTSGHGFGYGYANAFAEGWAFFAWIQWSWFEGSHKQSLNGVTTITVDDIEAQSGFLTAGISYEFLRDNPKHTLNLFGGPAIMSLDVTGQIKTFDSSNGNQGSAYQGHYDGLLPSALVGVMYDYDFAEDFQVVPYAMLAYSFADECQEYRVDHVTQANEFVTQNSPLCGEKEDPNADGETDISPSFFTIGIRFTYVPWGLTANASGIIRDAIQRNDEERRAPVKGTLFSLSKSW